MIVALSLLSGSALAQDAEVRFLHLSPDSGLLEAYVDGALVASGADYLSSSTPTTTPPAFSTVEVAEDGSGGVPVLATGFVTFTSGARHDLVAYGAPGSLGVLALQDDATGIPVGGNRLQFSHVAAGVGSIDMFLPAASTLVVDDLPLGGSDALDIPASGAFKIALDLDNDQGADWTFWMPNPGVGQHVNLLLVAEGTDLSMVMWLADGSVVSVPGVFIPKPTVQFFHFSPDTPAADMYIGFSFDPTFTDLEFGEGSDSVPIKRGPAGYTLAPAGLPPTSPFGEGAADLEADTDYTTFVYGLAGDLKFGQSTTRFMDGYEGSTGLRILNLGVDLGTIDVYHDGVLLIDDLAYGKKDLNPVDMGAVSLGIDLDDDGTVDETFSLPDLGEQFINLFLVTDDLGAPFAVVDYPDHTTLRIDPD